MVINQKIKLILSDEDKLILDSQSRMCNKLYNMLLEEAIKDKENNYQRKLLQGRNLRNLVVTIKKEHRYFYAVHSSPLKNVALRLKEAYSRFFEKNNNSGYPKFKSFNAKWFSLFYDEPNKGIKIDKKHIKISLGYNLDENGKKQRLYVNGLLDEEIISNNEIRNYRITKEHNNYYLIVCLDKTYQENNQKTNKSIAIDPNISNFFVGIDNEGKSIEIGKLTMIKYFDKQIDKVKSKRDKCLKKSTKGINKYTNKEYDIPSRRYKYLNNVLNKLYLKRQSQIKTALFTIANKLCDEYDVISIGNYTPSPDTAKYKTMHRAMLNQSPIGMFRSILEHVCNKRGKKYILVDEANTTKECFNCKGLYKKDPTIREYTCPCCNKKYYRDINSAINIGIKANILSGSDYVGKDLSKPMYIARYIFNKGIIY